MNPEVYKSKKYHRITTRELTKSVSLTPGDTHRINVVGLVKEGPDAGTVFPYSQIEVYVPDPDGIIDGGAREQLVFMLIFVGLALILACFLFYLGNPVRNQRANCCHYAIYYITLGKVALPRSRPVTR
jgi:hypothetical protein